MTRRPALGLAALLIAAAPSAQTADCETGTAQVALDAGDVTAPLFTSGALFWQRGEGDGYRVPAGAGTRAMYMAALWIGGEIGTETRFAGSTFGPYEFWPGPLDRGAQTTRQRCAAFDRLWSVRHADVVAYAAAGTASADLAGWPVAQGAPFYVDANGNHRRDAGEPRQSLGHDDDGYSPTLGGGRQIDLAAGERPDIVGDHGVWWVMNDAGNAHGWSGSDPLNVEVQVLAVAFGEGDRALRQSTVYEYTVVNRGVAPISDLQLSWYAEVDVGDASDDFVATDPGRGLLIAYNGDEDDVGSPPDVPGYGASPPALGIDVLSGANGAHQIGGGGGGGPTGYPSAGEDREQVSRRLQRGLWKDGVAMTVGGGGYTPGSTNVTTWAYSGDPVTYGFWTEEQTDPSGDRNTPSDRTALVHSAPVALALGERARIDVAVLFAEGGDGRTRLHNVSRLRDLSDAVQAAYDAGGTGALPGVSVAYTPAVAAPAAPPALVGPADGADLGEPADPFDGVSFAWEPVGGADAYRLDVSADGFATVHHTETTTMVEASLRPDQLPANVTTPVSWRVVPVNWGGAGPASEVRSFTYRVYRAEALRLSDGTPAFVEVAGPGGADPCGASAVSTTGCDEVGGNGVFLSENGTGDYRGVELFEGALADNLGSIGPRDVEVRFTGAGGFAVSTPNDRVVRVPFEVWDIGATRPGAPNDPADDVRLLPQLYLPADAFTEEAECAFEYGADETTPFLLASTPASGDSYQAFESVAQAALATGDCPASDDLAALANLGEPVLFGFALERVAGSSRGTADLGGTVIRFYTTDPFNVASAPGPDAGLALAVHPNPVAGGAAVPFRLAAPADVRLTVVDVLGREVAVLADGPRAAGEHRARFETAGLATGVYVVVLEASGARATRTVTVVR